MEHTMPIYKKTYMRS